MGLNQFWMFKKKLQNKGAKNSKKIFEKKSWKVQKYDMLWIGLVNLCRAKTDLNPLCISKKDVTQGEIKVTSRYDKNFLLQ